MVADTENSSCGQVYPSEILSQSPRSGRWESYTMSGNTEFYNQNLSQFHGGKYNVSSSEYHNSKFQFRNKEHRNCKNFNLSRTPIRLSLDKRMNSCLFQYLCGRHTAVLIPYILVVLTRVIRSTWYRNVFVATCFAL